MLKENVAQELPADVIHENAWEQAGYTPVPNVVLRDPGLSQGAKLAYGLLKSYAWFNKSLIHPGQAALASYLGVSDRQIRDYVKDLEEAGLIRVARVGLRKTNRYLLLELAGRYPDRNDSSDQNPQVPSSDRNHSSALDRNHSSAPDKKENEEKEEQELKLLREGEEEKSRQGNGANPANVLGDPQPLRRSPPFPRGKKGSELWNAFRDEIGEAVTKSERGRRNKAIAELAAVGASGEDVRQACETFRRVWPGMTLTPTAISSNWSTLSNGAGRELTPEESRRRHLQGARQ